MTETQQGPSQQLLVELTADIVAAYVSNHVVQVSDEPACCRRNPSIPSLGQNNPKASAPDPVDSLTDHDAPLINRSRFGAGCAASLPRFDAARPVDCRPTAKGCKAQTAAN